MAIARYYTGDGSSFFPGVPTRDLEQDEFDALPKWLQDSVDASPDYRKTEPKSGGRVARKANAPSDPEQE